MNLYFVLLHPESKKTLCNDALYSSYDRETQNILP